MPCLGQSPDRTRAAACLPYHMALQNAFISEAERVQQARKDWEWTLRHWRDLCGTLQTVGGLHQRGDLAVSGV